MINLGIFDLYIKVWISEFDLHLLLLFFSSQSELHSVPDIDFFAKLRLILSQLELLRKELPECTPSILMENCDHTICPVLSILFYDTVCKAWLFEKFIFELEASYSFIITCILVRRVISLGKIGVAISKIYCLVSWSPICTLLTLYQH